MPDKAQAARLRKMRFAMRRAATHLPPGLPPLFSLTDPARTPDPTRLARTLPKGTGLIYRHYGADDRQDIADGLAHISARRGLVLLIANDALLARAVGADGVHWPEANLTEARKWRGAFNIMTCSAHSRLALRHANRAGVTAALLSAIYPSGSPSAGPPIGPRRFRQLARGANLPVYALGGVTGDNAGQVAPVGGLATIEESWNLYGGVSRWAPAVPRT